MVLLLAMVLATTGPAAQPQPPPDLEVVGQIVRNLDYEGTDDPDDLIGHGWITAHFQITQTLRGRPPSRLITIRYLSHTYRRAHATIRLKLRANANGTHTVCAEPGGFRLVCG